MARHNRPNSLCSVSGYDVDLEPTSQRRRIGVVAAGGVDEVGQCLGAGGIDEQAADLAQRVVAGGAGDGQRRFQCFVDRQDLLDDDPRLGAGQLAQPCQIAGGIGQSVGVIDAESVDDPVGEPACDLDVGGVEDRAVLLAQRGQRGDREEPPVPADVVAPPDEPVVLAVVHLAAGTRTGTRRRWATPGCRGAAVAVDDE